MVRVARPRLARCSCVSGFVMDIDFVVDLGVVLRGEDDVVRRDDGEGGLSKGEVRRFGEKKEDIDGCEILCLLFGWCGSTTTSSSISCFGSSLRKSESAY